MTLFEKQSEQFSRGSTRTALGGAGPMVALAVLALGLSACATPGGQSSIAVQSCTAATSQRVDAFYRGPDCETALAQASSPKERLGLLHAKTLLEVSKGRFDQARDTSQEFLALGAQITGDTRDTHLLLAEGYAVAGALAFESADHQRARTFLDKSVAAAPYHSELRSIRGQILVELGEPEAAKEDLRMAMALNADNLDALTTYLSLSTGEDDWREALAINRSMADRSMLPIAVQLSQLNFLLTLRKQGVDVNKEIESLFEKTDEELSDSAVQLGSNRPDDVPENVSKTLFLLGATAEAVFQTLEYQFYFEEGRYADALRVVDRMEKAGKRTRSSRIFRARALEKSGDMKAFNEFLIRHPAMKEYLEKNPEAPKLKAERPKKKKFSLTKALKPLRGRYAEDKTTGVFFK